MTYGVQGRFSIQMLINNVEIPLNDNLLSSLHRVESTQVSLPMLTFKISDVTRFFTRNDLLLDGAQVTITTEINEVRETTYFRLFSSKESLDNGVSSYTVQCYLDVPKYWIESASEAYQGSASGALDYVCAKTGLQYRGLSTADSQLWIPHNRRYREWAKFIGERAWTGDKSCCVLGVTSDKRMLLKDISNAQEEESVQKFSNKDNSKEQTVVTDVQVLSRSGFHNVMTGYKEQRVMQSLVGAGTSAKELGVRRLSSKLMMNKDIQDNTLQAGVSFSPIDVGNVSETYEKALYQNRRLGSLFAFGLQLVTPLTVKAQLLDTVSCEIAKPDIDGVEQLNGKYVVGAKVLYIRGLNVYYKLEIFRQGINTKNESQV